MAKNVNRTARLQWKVDTIKDCIYLQCSCDILQHELDLCWRILAVKITEQKPKPSNWDLIWTNVLFNHNSSCDVILDCIEDERNSRVESGKVWSLTILLSRSRGQRPNFIMHTAPDCLFLFFAVGGHTLITLAHKGTYLV